MPGASLALFADLGACHAQKSSVTICVLPAPFRWKATSRDFAKKVIVYQISIHALRVEGDGNAEDKRVAQLLISIHALRVEGDCTHLRWMPRNARFLSTPSGWRATLVPRADRRRRGHFYPRPPGGGRHSILITTPRWKRNFYPRPPGGGRQQKQTKFSSVFAQKGEEFASLRRGKRKFAGGVLKRTNFGF